MPLISWLSCGTGSLLEAKRKIELLSRLKEMTGRKHGGADLDSPDLYPLVGRCHQHLVTQSRPNLARVVAGPFSSSCRLEHRELPPGNRGFWMAPRGNERQVVAS